MLDCKDGGKNLKKQKQIMLSNDQSVIFVNLEISLIDSSFLV